MVVHLWNITKIIKLYTLNKSVLWYVNYFSVKMWSELNNHVRMLEENMEKDQITMFSSEGV